jgi:hypothetical protein
MRRGDRREGGRIKEKKGKPTEEDLLYPFVRNSAGFANAARRHTGLLFLTDLDISTNLHLDLRGFFPDRCTRGLAKEDIGL